MVFLLNVLFKLLPFKKVSAQVEKIIFQHMVEANMEDQTTLFYIYAFCYYHVNHSYLEPQHLLTSFR